jgi:hypothetical protein
MYEIIIITDGWWHGAISTKPTNTTLDTITSYYSSILNSSYRLVLCKDAHSLWKRKLFTRIAIFLDINVVSTYLIIFKLEITACKLVQQGSTRNEMNFIGFLKTFHI